MFLFQVSLSVDVIVSSIAGSFGPFRVDIGLMLGYMASALACTMESIGDYAICAQISEERHPPLASTNRAILCEGIGATIAAVMGVGVGVTTYGENIALMQVTKVQQFPLSKQKEL